jgi:hypothetical protein
MQRLPFKADAVKAEETATGPDPQESIGCLSQCPLVRGGAGFRRPSGVMKLRHLALRIEGGARQG